MALEWVGPENHIKLTTCSTEYRIQLQQILCTQNYQSFFYMALGLNALDRGKSITRAIGRRWALKILTFLGPNGTRFARCRCRAQKSLDFQGPSLPMTIEMDFPPSKSLRPAPFKQQVQYINSYTHNYLTTSTKVLLWLFSCPRYRGPTRMDYAMHPPSL